MGVTSSEHGLTMEGMEEEGKKSVNCKWLNFFGPYGTPLHQSTIPGHVIFIYLCSESDEPRCVEKVHRCCIGWQRRGLQRVRLLLQHAQHDGVEDAVAPRPPAGEIERGGQNQG